MPFAEKKLIRQIRRLASRRASVITGVGIGIGDDCAVLRVPPGHELLVTTDFTLENVHFRPDWHPPEFVGWRCLTRGLSDIAAMGGEPRAVFLSLAVSSDVPQKWVDRFLHGLLDLAQEFNVPLAGGDTAQSAAGIQADIVVVGSVPKGKAVLRSGAKPDQYIYVTGELGGAAAALSRLADSRLARRKFAESKSVESPLPQPRVAVGLALRRRGLASAMIDLSDGLSTDLDHICQESHVGAEIETNLIPRAQLSRTQLRSKKEAEPVALDFALHGGDDYELLFTSSERISEPRSKRIPALIPAQIAGVRVTRIGRTTKSPGMRLIGTDGKAQGLQVKGWEHFKARAGKTLKP
jgi:thiamine-monophosphate kinase